MKKLIATIILSWGAIAVATEPTVTDVTARQRYPWNGLVDITCKVTGVSGTGVEQYFSVAAVMPDSGDVRKVAQFWVVRNGTNSTDRTVSANGSYRLLWDASADLGQVTYDNMVMRVTVKTRKVQLWEGGPYWASTNIGAEDPEDYGYYFWWGDTVGYQRENDKWVASNGSSSDFSFWDSNTPTSGKDNATLQSEGWITANNVLAPEHDAAHVHWGGAWRMPTKQELDDLNNKCDWAWTTVNGVQGYVVKGKGTYASASIFLPCAGFGRGASLGSAGSGGFYWSSVPYSDYNNTAWFLYFNSGNHSTGNNTRNIGQFVRPVQGFTN